LPVYKKLTYIGLVIPIPSRWLSHTSQLIYLIAPVAGAVITLTMFAVYHDNMKQMTSKLRHELVSIDIKMPKSILTKEMHCQRISVHINR